jgi:hypothetical protein
MIRIAITAEARAAFDAVSFLLPLGMVSFEGEPDADGEQLVWLAPNVFNCLRGLRDPGESYSDVILKLVKLKAKRKL